MRKFFGKRPKFPSGFTLVELIVVISIIAILWTLGLVSLQGYSANSRDSVRAENLSAMYKGLQGASVTMGSFPMPENGVTITASGVTIGYQGYAKDQTASLAKLSPGAGKDPLDGTYFTYSVNANQSKAELLAFFEKDRSFALLPTPEAYAASDNSKRFADTKGDSLGTLLASGTLAPVQEAGTNVDIVNTNTTYVAQFSRTDSVSGTGKTLFTNVYNHNPSLLKDTTLAGFDQNLVGYWDMENIISGVSGYSYFKDLSKTGNNIACLNYSGGTYVQASCWSANQVSGKIGKGFYVNNVGGGYVQGFTNWGYWYLLPLKSFTLASWVKVNSYTGHGVFRMDDLSPDVSNRLRINLSDNKEIVANLFLSWGQVASSNDIVSPPINLGSWVHIATTFDEKTRKLSLYVNGSFVGSSTHSDTTSYVGGYFIENWVWDGSADNVYDELRIYDRTLSNVEIQALYDATK